LYFPNKYSKPEPIIEQYKFTPEELEDIKNILKGIPPRAFLNSIKKRNFDVDRYLKNKSPMSDRTKIDLLKHKYFGGLCCMCNNLPTHKAIYKLKDITLIERYCEEHISKA
jgi:hypothetical protein